MGISVPARAQPSSPEQTDNACMKRSGPTGVRFSPCGVKIRHPRSRYKRAGTRVIKT
uniref:B9 n=1 Tax=Human betaherpesvirus 6 TaxID=10368 RepID=A0A5P9U7K3_9BETA|nr:hypothetical protein [Human betaherpesvirus 6]